MGQEEGTGRAWIKLRHYSQGTERSGDMFSDGSNLRSTQAVHKAKPLSLVHVESVGNTHRPPLLHLSSLSIALIALGSCNSPMGWETVELCRGLASSTHSVLAVSRHQLHPF